MDPPAGSTRQEPVPEVGLTVVFEPDRPSLEYDLRFRCSLSGYLIASFEQLLTTS